MSLWYDAHNDAILLGSQLGSSMCSNGFAKVSSGNCPQCTSLATDHEWHIESAPLPSHFSPRHRRHYAYLHIRLSYQSLDPQFICQKRLVSEWKTLNHKSMTPFLMPKFGSQPPAHLPLLSLIIPPAPAPHDHPVVKPSLFSFALPRVDHEPSLFILIAVWGRACPPSLNLVGTGRNNKETEIRKKVKERWKKWRKTSQLQEFVQKKAFENCVSILWYSGLDSFGVQKINQAKWDNSD